MNIANLGAFGAGLVRGDIAAREQRRLEEDQAFQNEQRAQLRDQWARDKEERDAVAAVQRPGVYRDPQAILNQDFTQSDAIPTRTVTDADFARNLAGAYKYSPEKAIAAINTANQFDQNARTVRQQTLEDQNLNWYQTELANSRSNPAGYVSRVLDSYNNDLIGGPDHKGVRATLSPDGQHVVVTGGPAGDRAHFVPVQQAIQGLLNDELMARMAGLSAAHAQQYADWGIKRENADAARMTAGAHLRTAEATEGYRKWMETRPLVHTDGQGRIVVLNSEGTKQLGTYGSARPDPNAGMNAIRDPKAYQQAVTEYNNLAAQYQNETDPTKRGAILKSLNVAEVKVSNALGKPVQLKLGNDPKDTNFMRDPNGGSFFTNAQGMPTARMDERGEFPMIPFGIDPRTDKKWSDISGKLGNAGAALTVLQNQTGNLQWGYKGKDGRVWSTWQEAIAPPELKQDPSGAPRAGTATREPAQPQVSGDKTQKVGLDRSAANPYVDTKGRPTGARVAGDDRSLLQTSVIPAVKDVASSVSNAMNDAGARYLKQKIDSGATLTPTEQAQARRAGLIK